MNLQKLFTCNGPMYVDASQLQGLRKILTIYTARGNRLADVGKTNEVRQRAMYGVHKDNLVPTQELAEANRERIWTEIRNKGTVDAPLITPADPANSSKLGNSACVT